MNNWLIDRLSFAALLHSPNAFAFHLSFESVVYWLTCKQNRYHGMVRPLAYHQQPQQLESVRRLQYHDDTNDGVELRGLQGHVISEAPCSPTETDSTSGCSSAAASNSDGDGSPRRPAVQPQNEVADQPRSSPPSTPADTGGGASTCCGCTGDREGSARPGDRSVSRGVGYCCTVQPIDRPVTPLSPPTPTTASPTPQPAALPSVDVTGSSRDELLLAAPRLVPSADRRSLRLRPPPLPPPRRTSLKKEQDQQTWE